MSEPRKQEKVGILKICSWLVSGKNIRSNFSNVSHLIHPTSHCIDRIYLKPVKTHHVKQIYSSELQWNKANSSNTEAPFLDLHLTISDGFVSSKMYDKRNDFDFDIVNFYS